MGQALEITRLGYALGAEVRGVDLRRPLATETIAAIRAAWLAHNVLCFPDQDLTPAQLVAFSRAFGEIDDNRALPFYRHPEFDEVMVISNKPTNGKPSVTRYNGRNWHSDLSYTVRPALGTILNAKELPEVGGNTMFASMYAAYATLSPTLAAFLDTLQAVHDVTLVKGFEERAPEQVAELRRLNPPVVHPVVREHPETGRKALYVSERVRHFVGLTRDESEPLLQFLNRHAVCDEFVYRHRYRRNDLVMWDNRCTMHLALADFDETQPRHMIRTSVRGARTGTLYAPDGAVETVTAPAAPARSAQAAMAAVS